MQGLPLHIYHIWNILIMLDNDINPEFTALTPDTGTSQVSGEVVASESYAREGHCESLIEFIWELTPKHRHDHEYFHDDCFLCGCEKERFEKINKRIEGILSPESVGTE